MTMTRTYTRTHVYVEFADPYLVCDLCRQPRGEPMTDQPEPVHGCTIDGQPAMPIRVAEYNQLITRLAEAEAALVRPSLVPDDNPATDTDPAWTPPPPGDKREQLPDAMLDLIRGQMPDYLSTACQTADTLACAACYPGSGVPRPQYDEIREHAERLHNRCRINQKFTGQLCACGCHA